MALYAAKPVLKDLYISCQKSPLFNFEKNAEAHHGRLCLWQESGHYFASHEALLLTVA
jgi:hypothetical protein